MQGIAVIEPTRFASASYDKTVRIWAPLDGRCVAALKGHTAPVVAISTVATTVCLSRALLVSGSLDKTARVWDADAANCLAVLKGHADAVRCVGCLSDGRPFTGSDDGKLFVWPPPPPRLATKLSPDNGVMGATPFVVAHVAAYGHGATVLSACQAVGVPGSPVRSFPSHRSKFFPFPSLIVCVFHPACF